MHMFWRTNDGIGGAGRNTEFASDAKLWINYGRFKGNMLSARLIQRQDLQL